MSGLWKQQIKDVIAFFNFVYFKFLLCFCYFAILGYDEMIWARFKTRGIYLLDRED